jgi:hypothetical protein
MDKQSLQSNEIIKEFLELHLHTESDCIALEQLVLYLKNTEALVKSINQTLNLKYSIGYDDISISICSIKNGSIRIPIWINKFINNPYVINTTSAVFAWLILNLFQNNETPVTIESSTGDYYEISNNVLLENKSTAKSVCSIAQTVIKDDSIRSLSLRYDKSNGTQEEVNITKKTLLEVAKNCDIEADETSYINYNVHLKIVSPVLENKPGASWRVELNGRKFYAKMIDNEFLKDMCAQKIAFAEGDEIVADIEYVITEKDDGTQTQKRYIRKVHSSPKYTRIIKHEQSQLTLDF